MTTDLPAYGVTRRIGLLRGYQTTHSKGAKYTTPHWHGQRSLRRHDSHIVVAHLADFPCDKPHRSPGGLHRHLSGILTGIISRSFRGKGYVKVALKQALEKSCRRRKLGSEHAQRSQRRLFFQSVSKLAS